MPRTTKTPPQRFLDKVQMPESNHNCWIWTGCTRMGYGTIGINNKDVRTHRYSYILFNGPIKPGNVIMHTCDNPICVNPNHLRQGTQKDNTHDCLAKGRHRNQIKTHCIHGHEYTEENTYTKPNGNRTCRECVKIKRRSTKVECDI